MRIHDVKLYLSGLRPASPLAVFALSTLLYLLAYHWAAFCSDQAAHLSHRVATANEALCKVHEPPPGWNCAECDPVGKTLYSTCLQCNASNEIAWDKGTSVTAWEKRRIESTIMDEYADASTVLSALHCADDRSFCHGLFRWCMAYAMHSTPADVLFLMGTLTTIAHLIWWGKEGAQYLVRNRHRNIVKRDEQDKTDLLKQFTSSVAPSQSMHHDSPLEFTSAVFGFQQQQSALAQHAD